MKRRSVLATMGVGISGLGGCQALGLNDRPTTPTRTPPECDTPNTRRVELASTGRVPSNVPLSISATVERQQISAEGTATVQVALQNESTTTIVTVTDDSRCHIFNRDGGLSDPRGVWLHREQDAPTDRVGDCWTRDAIPPDGPGPGFNGYGCPRRRIEADESISTTYEVWDDYTIDGYLPAGTYRFEQPIQVWQDEGDSDPVNINSDPTMFDWWLDLEITPMEN